jgi:acyl carrier protein
MDQLEQQVIEIIAKKKKVDPSTITLDSTFQELAIDSLDGMDLIFTFEDTFNISVPDNVVQQMKRRPGGHCGPASGACQALVAAPDAAADPACLIRVRRTMRTFTTFITASLSVAALTAALPFAQTRPATSRSTSISLTSRAETRPLRVALRRIAAHRHGNGRRRRLATPIGSWRR